MRIEELINKGLIMKAESDKKQIEGSLQLAQRFIERAEENLKIELWDVAFLMAYNSMFHSARALLFKKNLKERSHQAMITALMELYPENKQVMRMMSILGSYKVARNAIQYDGGLCSEIDATEALKDAKRFINEAEETALDSNR